MITHSLALGTQVVTTIATLFLGVALAGCPTPRNPSPAHPAPLVSLAVHKSVYAPGDSIRVTIANDSPIDLIFNPNQARLMQIKDGVRHLVFDRYYPGPNPEISPPRPLSGEVLPSRAIVKAEWRLDDDLPSGTYLYTLSLYYSDSAPTGASSSVASESEPFTIEASENP